MQNLLTKLKQIENQNSKVGVSCLLSDENIEIKNLHLYTYLSVKGRGGEALVKRYLNVGGVDGEGINHGYIMCEYMEWGGVGWG